MYAVVDPLDFGRRLQRRRARVGLSQRALAQRTGLTRGGVQALERGTRTNPGLRTTLPLGAGVASSGMRLPVTVTH